MAKPNPEWEGEQGFSSAAAITQEARPPGLGVHLSPAMVHVVRVALATCEVPVQFTDETTALITALHLSQFGGGHGPDTAA